MSQHRIIGSEAFDRRPLVYVRSYRMGAFRRRRGRTLWLIGLGAIGGVAAAVTTLVALSVQLPG